MYTPKVISFIFFAALTIGFVPTPTLAFQQISDTFVFIPEEQEIDDNLLVVGDSIDISGTIKGDLIVAASVVNIKGRVEGDVIAVAGDVTISGPVDGDVRVLAGTLIIENTVGGNVTAASGKVGLASEAEIGHSVTAATGHFENNGAVVKNINVASGSAIINGPLGENLNVHIDREGQLMLLPGARIGGDINYSAFSNLNRAPGAEVAGIIRRIDTSTVRPELNIPVKGLFIAFKTLSFLGALIVGLLLINLFPNVSNSLADSMLKEPFKLTLFGFAYFFLTPVVIILTTLTLIGMPLAVILIALFLTAVYFSKIVVGLAIGKLIIKKTSSKEVGLFFALFFGILSVYVISSVPYIGWLASALITWWGLAGIIQWSYNRYND